MGDKTEGKVSALILKHARHVVVSSWLAHETGPLFLCGLLGTGRARDRPGAASSAPPCLRWALLKRFFPEHHSEYHPSAPFGPLTTLEPGCHGLLRARAPRRSSLARGALFPLLTPLKGSLVPFPGVLSAAALFAAHSLSLPAVHALLGNLVCGSLLRRDPFLLSIPPSSLQVDRSSRWRGSGCR